MARYTADELLRLRNSPLCIKPLLLPPPEEWMGSLPENFRNPTNKATNERSKPHDNPLLDQTNRRPGAERHMSRNSANPADIILGPPRMNFASSTSMRAGGIAKPPDGDKAFQEADTRDRFALRTRAADLPDNNPDRFREGRTNFRRRGEPDQDSEGWSTVKPRKSFGHEGAERFHGRMGGGDRYTRDDRRIRDRDDAETTRDRPRRAVEHHSKDKDGEDPEAPRRNGLARGRSEPWFKDASAGDERPSMRERIDRAKSWRDRDPEDRMPEGHKERASERTYGNRWDRDQRVEREPEWLDEPAEEGAGGKTEEDFKKFMENMKAKNGDQKQEAKGSGAAETSAGDSFFSTMETPMPKSAPAVERGPDRFFEQFAKAGRNENGAPGEASSDGSKVKSGKSSRFHSFFSSQEDTRRVAEPPLPVAAPPLAQQPPNGLDVHGAQSSPADKEAFQVLLQKLQHQTLPGQTPVNILGGPPPPLPAGAGAMAGFQPPPAQPGPHLQESAPDLRQKRSMVSPEPFQAYGRERSDDPRFQVPQQAALQDILQAQRSMGQGQSQGRPEQMLQDGRPLNHQGQQHPGQQHQGQQHPGLGNNRIEQHAGPDARAQFLMTLMQNHRTAPPPPRTEELLVRMPQPQKQVSVPPIPERDLEAEYHRERERERERSAAQRQQMRGHGPPSLFEEQFQHRVEQDNRPPQPTQILQRPGPLPGMDQLAHHFMPPGGQMPPPQQQRPMIPPPGLPGNQGRPHPSMFPPNFPGAFHPDGMPGPPRNMGPPPGFFGGPPPPQGPPSGFMPPPGMGFQGPPPDSLAFQVPFDGHGMPPPGAGFRRHA